MINTQTPTAIVTCASSGDRKFWSMIPQMCKQKSGHIVSISTSLVDQPIAGPHACRIKSLVLKMD